MTRRAGYEEQCMCHATAVFEIGWQSYKGGPGNFAVISLGFGDAGGVLCAHQRENSWPPALSAHALGESVPICRFHHSEPLGRIQTIKEASDLDLRCYCARAWKEFNTIAIAIKLISSLEAIQVKVKEAIINGVNLKKLSIKSISQKYWNQFI